MVVGVVVDMKVMVWCRGRGSGHSNGPEPMETDGTVKDKGKAQMVDDDEDKPHKSSTTSMSRSDDDTWKLYAYYPQFGTFEVHKGVVVVAGVGRIGLMYITLPAEVR